VVEQAGELGVVVLLGSAGVLVLGATQRGEGLVAVADEVTAPNTEDGVALVLERWF
jgi:hypothetical protein